MKKSSSIILTIIVLIILVGGGYALFHKPSSKTNSGNTSNSSQTGNTGVNNSILTTKTDSSLGQYLADPSGKPLYTYGADSSGVSNCTGACLTSWPAYTASVANLPAGVSTITRTDNHQVQYTYNGLPLYYFTGDSAGSKPTGDGVSNFKIAKPASSNSSSSQPTSPAPASSNSSNNSSYGSPY